MSKIRNLFDYIVSDIPEFSPEFIKDHPESVPFLFNVSLTEEIDVRTEKIPEFILYLAEQVINFDIGILYLWEPQHSFHTRGIRNELPDQIEEGSIFTGTIRRSSKPILIQDGKYLEFSKYEMPLNFSSMMGIPVYVDSNIIGSLELYRKKGISFDLNDITILKQLIACSEKLLRKTPGSSQDYPLGMATLNESSRKNNLNMVLKQNEEQAKRLSYHLSIAIISLQENNSASLHSDNILSPKMLVTVEKAFRDTLRCYDTILKYEEKSLLVILPGCTSREAHTVISKVALKIEPTIRANMKIGIATLPEEAQDSRSLINAAHQALSYAVRRGVASASFLDIETIKPSNISMELSMKKFLNSMPTRSSLNLFLDMVKNQTHAKELSLNKDGVGQGIYWEDKLLGHIYHEGLPQEVFNWVTTYFTPAWAVVEGFNSDIKDWSLSVLSSAAILSDIRAGYPVGYSIKVSDQVYTLAKSMGRTDDEALRWAHSAMAANIGYAGIPTSILTKGEVNPFDTQKIRNHPIISASIIRDVPQLNVDFDILMHHHEHVNGSGYPRGLKGKDIPLGARALRVVDTFSAMVSPRLYKPLKDKNEAANELVSQSGITLDPEITSKYLDLVASC